ncbi:hypothetical protein WMY93_003159 [Mugilogobius chulae]|uniref:SAND domain-containing protein n=1 Tax=Mugilogobius chulae TaxID=88201 RepID=A0AAW0PVT8_9GOBI
MTDWINDIDGDELLNFLSRHKNPLSCMKNPQTFVRQLRDKLLISSDIYKTLKGSQDPETDLYDALDWITDNKKKYIHHFWKCVFEKHIMDKYPLLKKLQEKMFNRLKGNSQLGKHDVKPVVKRPVSVCDEEQPGPSSHVTQPAKPKASSSSVPKQTHSRIPVTCGGVAGLMDLNELTSRKAEQSAFWLMGSCILPLSFNFLEERREARSGKQASVLRMNLCLSTFLGRCTAEIFPAPQNSAVMYDNPLTFVRQLLDYKLITERIYEKIESSQDHEREIYKALILIENNKRAFIPRFWGCVFKKHIVDKYATLKELQEELKKTQFKVNSQLGEQNEVRPVVSVCDEEQPGSSSDMTQSVQQEASSSSVPREAHSRIPVTCGDVTGMMDVKELNLKLGRAKCIWVDGKPHTPTEFERLGGKEKSKNWKASIRYKNEPLSKYTITNNGQLRKKQRRRRTRRVL